MPSQSEIPLPAAPSLPGRARRPVSYLISDVEREMTLAQANRSV